MISVEKMYDKTRDAIEYNTLKASGIFYTLEDIEVIMNESAQDGDFACDLFGDFLISDLRKLSEQGYELQLLDGTQKYNIKDLIKQNDKFSNVLIRILWNQDAVMRNR